MTVINLIDKSKLRALERRCNSKEMAEHVMSFLTVTTLRRLPAFAHDLFRHSIRTHYNGDEDLMSTGQVALDKCQQIPLAFIPQPNEKKLESETETECDRDTTNDSDAKEKTETVQVKGALRWFRFGGDGPFVEYQVCRFLRPRGLSYCKRWELPKRPDQV